MSTTEVQLKEILPFLEIGARCNIKTVATSCVLGLTGTKEGIASISQNKDILVSLIRLCYDSSHKVAKDASLCLVNLSADEKCATRLLDADITHSQPSTPNPPKDFCDVIMNFILDPNSKLADPFCMILSNITRSPSNANRVADYVMRTSPEGTSTYLEQLVLAFTKNKYNSNANLNYLAPVFSNLTQNSLVRRQLMSKEKCIIQRLLPFTEYKDSLLRRGGIVGALKNCCFERDYHEWLLGDEVDILPRLLLPLAGPEEFDDEDNEKLPDELQYLPNDKLREPDPDIRKMLLEAITQLCAKKYCREHVRDKNTYIILRELHKWENDKEAVLACENLVDLLIRKEEEIGVEDISSVEVPDDLAEKFAQMDKEFLENN